MCGRYLLDIDIENLEMIYDIVNKGEMDAQWRLTNAAPRDKAFMLESSSVTPAIFPTNRVPVVHSNRMGLMNWGYHLPTVKGPIVNCRIESLTEKPFYIEALAKRRVVIPATAYYEWRTIKGPKTPYTIYRKDKELLHMAGVYFKDESREGIATWSFAVVTTPSCGNIESLHDRMPLMLSLEHLDKWRNRDVKLSPKEVKLWANQESFETTLVTHSGILLAV